MDGCKGYRRCALAVFGGVGLMAAAAGAVRAEPLVQAARPAPGFEPAGAAITPAQAATIEVRGAVRALQRYAQEVAGELSADFTTLAVTMIGGHVTVPPTPPPPPVVSGTQPPPPPTDTGGTPTPPPPPTPTGGPTPTPPPPTTEGGHPSSAPEPATIVTGLVGLGLASAAGWYQRRRRQK